MQILNVQELVSKIQGKAFISHFDFNVEYNLHQIGHGFGPLARRRRRSVALAAVTLRHPRHHFFGTRPRPAARGSTSGSTPATADCWLALYDAIVEDGRKKAPLSAR